MKISENYIIHNTKQQNNSLSLCEFAHIFWQYTHLCLNFKIVMFWAIECGLYFKNELLSLSVAIASLSNESDIITLYTTLCIAQNYLLKQPCHKSINHIFFWQTTLVSSLNGHYTVWLRKHNNTTLQWVHTTHNTNCDDMAE